MGIQGLARKLWLAEDSFCLRGLLATALNSAEGSDSTVFQCALLRGSAVQRSLLGGKLRFGLLCGKKTQSITT